MNDDVPIDRAIPGLGPGLYAEWRAADIGVITDRLERRLILELAGNIAALRVLDVGCGDGQLALELRERGAIVTGIDASQEMIEAARARAARQGAEIVFEIAAAEHLPFAPDHSISSSPSPFSALFKIRRRCSRRSHECCAPAAGSSSASSADGATGQRRAASGHGAVRRCGASAVPFAGRAQEPCRAVGLAVRKRFGARSTIRGGVCRPVLRALGLDAGPADDGRRGVYRHIRVETRASEIASEEQIRGRDAGTCGVQFRGTLLRASAISRDLAPVSRGGAVWQSGPGSAHRSPCRT